MPIDKLPREILSTILQDHLGRVYLGREHLFVCKLWYNLIEPIVYKDITLDTNNLKKFQKKTGSLTKSKINLMESFRSFSHTQNLTLNDEEVYDEIERVATQRVPRLTTDEFMFLLSLFPALKSLDVVCTENRQHYLKILNTCDVKKLPPLEKLRLEEVNESDQEFNKLYFSVFYRFRDTLTTINIRYTRDYSIDYKKGILELLADFKNLTTIDFLNTFDPDLTLFHFLKAFPRLENITFSTDYTTPRNADGLFDDLLQHIKENRLTPNDYFKGLKVMEICQPDWTHAYTDLFTTHCPPNLKTLHFQLNKTDFYSWIKSLSLPKTLKLAKNMSNLRPSGFIFGEINNNVIVRKDSPNFGEKINDFYHFLRALKGDAYDKPYKAFYVDMLSPHALAANFQNSSEQLDFFYTLNHVDYGIDPNDNNVRLNGMIPYHTYPVPAPNATLIEEMKKISHMTFELQQPFLTSLPLVYMDHAAKYCTNLNHFEVRYRDFKCRVLARHRPGVRSLLKDMYSVIARCRVLSRSN